MKHHEIKPLMEKVSRFNALSSRLDLITELLKKLEPDNSSPFTGDTRESRRVVGLEIDFSATLGLAQPVAMSLRSLNIPAYAFGQFLEAQLNIQRKAVIAEMEAL